jgi:hypothetical protein
MSEASRQISKGDADSVVHWHVNSEFVVSAAKVLHERVPGRNRPCRGEAFNPRIGRSLAFSRP